jgi:hypothetical protein
MDDTYFFSNFARNFKLVKNQQKIYHRGRN